MRPLRAAATALVAVLALSGCDGGSDPTDPSPTAKPSDSSSVPSTTPPVETPTEPALPQAAMKATEAGARAFIAYYWDLINYAQLTGDVKQLRATSGPRCDACTGINDRLHDHYQAGGRIVGGTNRVEVIEASELSTTSKSAFGFRLKTHVTHDAQSVYDAQGVADERPSGTDALTAYLLWDDNRRWRLDIMEVN